MASAQSDTEDTDGYDYEFIPPIEDDFVCAICQLALKEPVQTKCGHRFCQECLAKFHRSSPRRSCPMDNQDLNPQDIFLDVATNRKILSHQVKCPNEGCNWTGELRELIGNDKHLKLECPCSVISCEFSDIGCWKKVQRRHLSQHLQSRVQQHLTLARKKIKELEMIVKTPLPKLVWKIPNFQQCMQKAKDGIKTYLHSDPFYTSPHGYKMKIAVRHQDGDQTDKRTHMAVFVCILKGEYDAILPWPFDKKITISIIDQQENLADRKNIHDSLQVPESRACQKPKSDYNLGRKFSKVASHAILNTRKYTLDNTLFLQVDVTDN